MLCAGPLTLLYEAGDLRRIRFGEREVVRRLYVAVRDRNWLTIPAVLSDVRIEVKDRSFQIAYTAVHREEEIDFSWQAEISGDEDGTLHFRMDGQARSSFWRNRIGFCLLHPIAECAGNACIVSHSDGTIEQGTFPTRIAPHQPFVQMQGISHEIMPSVWADLTFSGDVFEMEDQRNWTDASFKTYCTPLDKPFPVWIESGTRITQSITLRLRGAQANLASDVRADAVELSIQEAAPVPLPRLGVGVASHGQPLSAREIKRLQALHLDHLRIDVRLNEPEYPARLRQATQEAHAIAASLHIALHLSDAADEELARFASVLAEIKPPVTAWLVFHTAEKTMSARWVQRVRQAVAPQYAAAQLIGGTDAYFAEINRDRPPTAVLDGVTYSINPQVHAFDNLSLMETLEAQAATVESARQFCGNLPLSLSPITLKPRFNPNATGPLTESSLDMLPSPVDPRQMSLFAAGWTLGSLAGLAKSKVASLTYYETTGWRGLMEVEQGTPQPDMFFSVPSAVFPLYFVLHWVGEFMGGEMLLLTSAHPTQIEGIALRHQGRERLLLANLTNASLTVQMNLGALSHVWIQSLDERNAEEAMRRPEVFLALPGAEQEVSTGRFALELLPFSLVRIDKK